MDFVFIFLDYVDVQQPLKIKKRKGSIDIANKIIDQGMILSGNEIILHTDTNASTSANTRKYFSEVKWPRLKYCSKINS